MARPSPVFVCSSCGGETLKWQGQCPLCGEWNSLEQRSAPSARRASASPAAAVSLAVGAQEGSDRTRQHSGSAELDRVVGGGLVAGSVILLGGEPGIGKSTLLLQLAAHVGSQRAVLYASGEESVEQVSLRAQRLGLSAPELRLITETRLGAILALAGELRAGVLVIDSIQTVQSDVAATAAGAVSQLRECTAELVRFAKSTGTTVIIVGHVTKEGAIAGPKLLEHLVDTVLYFESDAGSRYRIVRATKNRFGAVNELGFFAMTGSGLREVRNPAAIFLARASEPAAGSIVTVTREGGRPLLIELQGLVDHMRFGAPRRVAQGLDANRLAMLLAAANRHAQLALQEYDVFVNVVGGIEITETCWDLPVLIALASSLRNRPLPAQLVAFGEVGLTGEVRPVAYGDERLREAQAQGFRTAVVPQGNAPRRGAPDLHVIGVSRIEAALEAALAAAP
jgi:DNA repair protein RadA/Sms